MIVSIIILITILIAIAIIALPPYGVDEAIAGAYIATAWHKL